MSTEKNNAVTEDEVTPVVLAGDLLRQKREELGISQQEIADRLRLRVSVIKSIDENDLDFDHVATFTRGYLRSYAKAVSLDEKVVLATLNGVKEAQHRPQSMQSFSRKTKRDKHDSRIVKLSWLILAVAIGISSVWWYQNQQDTLVEVSQQDLSEPAPLNLGQVAEEPASPIREEQTIEPVEQPAEDDVETQSAPVEEPVVEEVVSEPVVEEPVADVQEEVVEEIVIEEVVESVPVVEAIDNTLVMNFSSDCWVQVKDAEGKTLVTGVKKAGQNLNVEGVPPYSVVLGAPEGVKMTFASEPVDLSGYTSGKVARFTLP